MDNFLNNFFSFVETYIKKNYPKVKINFINIDKASSFNYEENESPLHNCVIYLNKKLLNSVKEDSTLLEIGCGATSILLSNEKNRFSRIDGLDIHEKDFRGRDTLANIIGSVSKIPIRSNFYDFCISNQSIEHWFEYNVSISQGISEISRVIKKDKGKMFINFPLFLHGKREFLQGNIELILGEISKYLSIRKITFVHSGSRRYKGWKKCGQSLYRVKKHVENNGIKGSPESIICEIMAVKTFESEKLIVNKMFSLIRFINLYSDHTLPELAIKIINKIKNIKK